MGRRKSKTMKIKYPRTYHVPWSDGVSSDDKIIKDLSHFEGREIVMTEKMDGENTTLMNLWYYARSLDSAHHPSQNWVKGLWGNIKHDIPEDWRICGENLYAQHSIKYDKLKSFFLTFSIWDENNYCLSIDETLEYCELLQIEHVPILYRGIWNEEKIKSIKLNTENQEGFVISLADGFHYDEFNKWVVKWVRKNHVQTDTHWKNNKIIPNKLI